MLNESKEHDEKVAVKKKQKDEPEDFPLALTRE